MSFSIDLPKQLTDPDPDPDPEPSETSFICLISPAHEPPSIYVPLYLVDDRRQSAPAMTFHRNRDRHASDFDQGGTDERAQMESSAKDCWQGLRRAMSLGSTGQYHTALRPRWTSLTEDDVNHFPETKVTDRIGAFHLPSNRDTHTAAEIRRFPSGPSSPSSTSRFTTSAPGRIFSGFSEASTEEEGLSERREEEVDRQRGVHLTAKLDTSPTIPPFRLSKQDLPLDVVDAYCPPSPALTSSPHPSFDSPDLSTPCQRHTVHTSPPLDHHLPLSSPSPLYDQGVIDASRESFCHPSSPKSKRHEREVSMSFEELHQGSSGDWLNQGTPDNPINPSTHPRTDPLDPNPLHTSSVPSSTRTTSTTSGGRSVPITPSDPTSPPISFAPLGPAVRRYSKAFPGSSGSSTHSSESSPRGHQSNWLERSDISTVFEEENSVDLEQAEQRENERRRKLLQGPLPRPSIDPPSLIHQSFAQRIERSGVISSKGSGSSRSKPHPFASAAVRSASPPSVPSSSTHNTFLSAKRPDRSANLATSRSHPNLAEVYRMPTPILIPAHQVALVSAVDKNDDELCPVCIESLSFTFRLPGEKPHIVPDCGHALHEVPQHCFDLSLVLTLPGMLCYRLRRCPA